MSYITDEDRAEIRKRLGRPWLGSNDALAVELASELREAKEALAKAEESCAYWRQQAQDLADQEDILVKLVPTPDMDVPGYINALRAENAELRKAVVELLTALGEEQVENDGLMIRSTAAMVRARRLVTNAEQARKEGE